MPRHELVEQVVAGVRQMRDLTEAERQEAHSAIDAAIARRAAEASLGKELLAEGQTIVALDRDGAVIEYSPECPDGRPL